MPKRVEDLGKIFNPLNNNNDTHFIEIFISNYAINQFSLGCKYQSVNTVS
jgi:hypothetical protein